MLWSWFKKLLKGEPHHAIGAIDGASPYLLRWYLLPRNPFLNLYLHKFLRDDRDEALHDHPWWFISFMIKGEYVEVTENATVRKRTAPALAYRPALWRHRIVLRKDDKGVPIPCYTIVLTGGVNVNGIFGVLKALFYGQPFKRIKMVMVVANEPD